MMQEEWEEQRSRCLLEVPLTPPPLIDKRSTLSWGAMFELSILDFMDEIYCPFGSSDSSVLISVLIFKFLRIHQ
jgi:hypothetical protein